MKTGHTLPRLNVKCARCTTSPNRLAMKSSEDSSWQYEMLPLLEEVACELSTHEACAGSPEVRSRARLGHSPPCARLSTTGLGWPSTEKTSFLHEVMRSLEWQRLDSGVMRLHLTRTQSGVRSGPSRLKCFLGDGSGLSGVLNLSRAGEQDTSPKDSSF